MSRGKRKRRGHYERAPQREPSIADRAAQLRGESEALANQAEDREKREDAERAALGKPEKDENPYVWANRNTLVHRGDGHVVLTIDGDGKMVAAPIEPPPAPMIPLAELRSPAVALLSRHQPNPPVVVR